MLADQQAGYVVAQLEAFEEGTRSGTTVASIMQNVVRDLDEVAMEDVAGYLSQTASKQVVSEQ